MSESRIAAIVVNWNQKELLLECMKSLYDSNYPDLFVIVIDNASEDGSAEAVANEFPDAILICNSENRGFAAANNQGLERALDEGAKYVFLLNSDATVEKRALKILHDYLETHKETAAAAPFIFYYDRPEIIWYGGGDVRIWRGWIGHKLLRKRYETGKHRICATDYLTGCALMARTEVMRDMKGFDERYGLYSEDVDLSLRMRRAGWDLKIIPDAHAFHRISASTGGALSPLKAFYRGRSTSLLFCKYARWWEVPTLVMLGFLSLCGLSAMLVLKGKLPTVNALWYGILCGLLRSRYIPAKYRLGFN